MLYQISGKQIDIGAALQTHVKSVVDAIASKYAERPTDASVIFSRSSNEFVCEVSVHLSTGLTAQAKAHDHEIYAAFDAAAEKLEKQLRRYKRRLKDHHKERAQPVEFSEASSYILAQQRRFDRQRAGEFAAFNCSGDGAKNPISVCRRGSDANGTRGGAGPRL